MMANMTFLPCMVLMKNRKIFFQASMKNPMESSVYSIDFDGKNLKELNAPSGYNSAQFSPTFDVFVLNKSTINTPPVFQYLKGISVLSEYLKTIKTF